MPNYMQRKHAARARHWKRASTTEQPYTWKRTYYETENWNYLANPMVVGMVGKGIASMFEFDPDTRTLTHLHTRDGFRLLSQGMQWCDAVAEKGHDIVPKIIPTHVDPPF